jgi:hypothetical protein
MGLPSLDGRIHPVVDVEDELLRAVLAVALPVRAVDDRERVQDVIDVVAVGVRRPTWMPWWMPCSSRVKWAGSKHTKALCPAPKVTVASRSS